MTKSFCDRCGREAEKPDAITISRRVAGDDLGPTRHAEFPPQRREFCIACAGVVWRDLSATLTEPAEVRRAGE